MSIEKSLPYQKNPSIEMSYQVIPYTQVYTHVIQNIKYMEAGFVWVYLQSKPETWEVIKEHIRKHFGIGEDRMKQIFAYLAAHRLIEYKKIRDDKGKIIKSIIHVLNGDKFLTDEELAELSTDKPSTGVKIHRVDKPAGGFQGTINKRNKIQIKNKNTNEREKSVDNFKKPPVVYAPVEKQSTSWRPCQTKKCSIETEMKHMSNIMAKMGLKPYHERININLNNEN